MVPIVLEKNLDRLREYVKKHWEDIYFPSLLTELSFYGTKNTDMVMAFGMALIHDMDATKRIYDKEEDENVEKMPGLPEYNRDKNGIITLSDNQLEVNLNNRNNNVTFDYDLDTDF